MASEKPERPYFTVVEKGEKRKEFIDDEGIKSSFGEIISDILKVKFKSGK